MFEKVINNIQLAQGLQGRNLPMEYKKTMKGWDLAGGRLTWEGGGGEKEEKGGGGETIVKALNK